MSKRDGRRVISGKNLGLRMPLLPTLTAWLVLDRLHAPDLIWGAVGLFFILVWIVWIHDQVTHQPIDVLSNRKPPE